MCRRKAFVLIAWAAAAFSGAACADTEIRVLATHPAGDPVALGSGQTFYLRLGYTTDVPVRIWARPFFEGREVNAGSNPSHVYSGSGEALGWFFFTDPGAQVDEIRIRAGDGSDRGTRVVATYPVRILASGRPAAQGGEPDWLAALRAEDERISREAFEAQARTPPGAGEWLFFAGFMAAVAALGIAGIVAPVLAMRRWRGGWRIAAAVPAAMMAFVVLRIVIDTAADPTSHNLWPFEILQVGVLSLAVFAALIVARRFSRADA